MLIELDNIVHCLRGLQREDSEQFEEQLTEICLNPSALINFKLILADPQVQQPTKKMAAVFFKNYFIERYCDFQEVFFVELVMSIILDIKVPYKYKIIIEQTIISMLEWIEKQNLQQVIDCISEVFSCLQKASGNQVLKQEKKSIKNNKNNLDPTRLNLKKICNFDIKNEEDFLNLSYSIVHFVECFTSVSTLDAEDLHRIVRISLSNSLTIFPIKNTEQNTRLQMVILHMWLGYIEMIQSQMENRPQLKVIQEEICQQKYLWQKILEVYQFSAYKFVSLQGQEALFVCSPQQPHKKIINKMKSYACQSNLSHQSLVHLKSLTYEIQGTQNFDILNSTISPILFSRLIKTLSYFSLQKSQMHFLNCQQFVSSLLSLLIYVSSQSPQIIDSNWANLLHLIIFPLLTIDEKQSLSFDDQPDEFCRLAEDCCDKQNLGEIKTQAARFLEMICDRNFTFCQYVMQYCCVSLETVVLKNQSNIDTSKTLLLSLQAAFMVLSILSYNLSKFELERSSIRKILLAPQCLKLTEIQASRIFLFLSYNYSEIFPNPLEGRMWINYAMSGNMHYTTKRAAFDFILNTVEEYFEEQFFVDFSAKLNIQVQIRQVWSIINKLLNNHLQKVSEKTMLKLIQNILERMSSEITKYKNRQIKSTQNVNSGLQMMRKVLSNHKYTSDKPEVLAEIYKVIPLYKTFKQLHLQDVILKIINEYIDKQERIPQIFVNMLSQLCDEFRQQGYRPTAFYWIWNQYVFKSQQFDKIREIKNLLVEGLRYFHQSFITQKRKTQNNLPIAHSFLILQHLLTIHGQKFPKNQIFQVYQLCTMFLPEDMNEPQRVNLSPTIIGRALIVMLICHMLIKNQQNEKGKKTDALKYLLLYHDEQDVFTGQNASVIIKLLCKQLFRQSDPVSVTEMINIMVRVLRPSQKEVSHHVKSKKSKNSLHFKIKAKQNFQMILKKIKSPFDFKIKNEQQLKNSLTTMKQNNQFLYKSIISYLPTQIKQKLRDLMSTNIFVSTQIQKTRKIFKIGGAKKISNEQDDDEETLKGPRKRLGNFNAIQQSEICEEIDENQLVLEKDKDKSDDNDDLKGKMKRNKVMKKLKMNEKRQQNFNHS